MTISLTTRYLLDTNICIYIAKYNPASVRARFAQHSANELAMSVITLGELRFGAEKSRTREQAIAVIEDLASLMNVEALSSEVATHYGEIRASLQKTGQMIGNNDLWLAAHARANDWILVTNNEKEFVRVDGLRVENWV
jgi:tRNA(fMet)-specific endonuclease VapC